LIERTHSGYYFPLDVAEIGRSPSVERPIAVRKPSSTIDSVVEDRRRPGRSEYTNPYLLPLLRQQNDFVCSLGGQGDQSEAWDNGSATVKYAIPGDTISAIDGASQTGHPQQESQACGDGPNLTNEVCYVAGEQVASGNGIVPVEHLTAGDVVLTHLGRKTVTWVRRFDATPAAAEHPEWSAPVCLRRNAIGPGLPGKDLLVSPSHRLWVEGRLLPAWRLVDGVNVVQDLGRVSVTYCRVLFAPTSQRTAPFWRTLARRTDRHDSALASPDTGPDRGVQLLVDGRPVDPLACDDRRLVFFVPSGHRRVQLVSAGGAAIVQIETITPDSHEIIPADHPSLNQGWGPCEHDADVMWRRVLGVADVPLSRSAGNAKVVVYLKTQ
jgi:Hint domain